MHKIRYFFMVGSTLIALLAGVSVAAVNIQTISEYRPCDCVHKSTTINHMHLYSYLYLCMYLYLYLYLYLYKSGFGCGCVKKWSGPYRLSKSWGSGLSTCSFPIEITFRTSNAWTTCVNYEVWSSLGHPSNRICGMGCRAWSARKRMENIFVCRHIVEICQTHKWEPMITRRVSRCVPQQ